MEWHARRRIRSGIIAIRGPVQRLRAKPAPRRYDSAADKAATAAVAAAPHRSCMFSFSANRSAAVLTKRSTQSRVARRTPRTLQSAPRAGQQSGHPSLGTSAMAKRPERVPFGECCDVFMRRPLANGRGANDVAAKRADRPSASRARNEYGACGDTPPDSLSA